MKNLSLLAFACIFSIALFAQNNQVKFIFDHQANGEPLVLDETEFEIWNGKKVVLERAEFYVSSITLTDVNDVATSLNDLHLLVRANENGVAYDAGQHEISSVKKVDFGVGVIESLNHEDPSSYPGNHPLAPKNPSMHWGWVAGYRFMAIEGKVDNNNDGVPETTFQYHNLGDQLYKMGAVEGAAATAENGEMAVHIVLDYAKLFGDISLSGNNIHHGSDAPNDQMLTNAVENGFFSMQSVSSSAEVLANSALVKLGPNPATASSTLFLGLENLSGELSLVITGPLGQVLHRAEGLPTSGSYVLDTSNFPAGLAQCAFFQQGELIAHQKLMVLK